MVKVYELFIVRLYSAVDLESLIMTTKTLYTCSGSYGCSRVSFLCTSLFRTDI